MSRTVVAGADLLQRRGAGRRFGPNRGRRGEVSGEGERGGAGLQTGSAGRPAEGAGLRALEPSRSSSGAQSRGGGSRQRGLPGLFSPLGAPRRLPSHVSFLQALHSLHVALGLLQNLLGQFLRIQLSRRHRPLLLGLDRAVCLGTRLVRLRAADLPFPGPLRG